MYFIKVFFGLLLISGCTIVVIGRGDLGWYVSTRYLWLVLGGALVLLFLAFSLLWQNWRLWRSGLQPYRGRLEQAWWILLLPFVAALLFPGRSLSSQSALQRGAGDTFYLDEEAKTLPFVIDSSERSFDDWVRLLEQNPDPIRYEGQRALLQGVVAMEDDTLPDEFGWLARFVVNCCAADARPVLLALRFSEENLPEDNTWVELEATLGVAELDNYLQVVFEVEYWQEIDAPENPYL